MVKHQIIGSVGAYLLREVSEGVWETLVHRRSKRVCFSKGLLATPGGFVEKKDAVDPQGIIRQSVMFFRGMRREVKQETDICVDSIDPPDVFELQRIPDDPPTHKNFGIILKTPLEYAKPQSDVEWEMAAGGVADIGTPVPGGFHSWVSLSDILQRQDVMPECRRAIAMLREIFDMCASSSSQSESLAGTDTEPERFRGSADSVLGRRGGSIGSAAAGTGGTPSSAFTREAGLPTTAPHVNEAGAMDSHLQGRRLRDFIYFCPDFQARSFYFPKEAVPLDVIRKHIGRGTKVKDWAKKQITKDKQYSVQWHARMTEIMFRGFCEDRGLGQLLGECRMGHESGLDYIEFDYLQPMDLETRNLDWLDDDISTLVRCGHGTYWETLPCIVASGSLTSSDQQNVL